MLPIIYHYFIVWFNINNKLKTLQHSYLTSFKSFYLNTFFIIYRKKTRLQCVVIIT